MTRTETLPALLTVHLDDHDLVTALVVALVGLLDSPALRCTCLAYKLGAVPRGEVPIHRQVRILSPSPAFGRLATERAERNEKVSLLATRGLIRLQVEITAVSPLLRAGVWKAVRRAVIVTTAGAVEWEEVLATTAGEVACLT